MAGKTCSRCGEEKELSNYYIKPNGKPKGPCYSCCRKIDRARRPAKGLKKSRKGQCPKEAQREYTLIYKYGIDLQDYNSMFEEQEGCCAICNKHQTELSRVLVVDHCHETNEVRGLLCSTCNTGIGLLGDNKQALKKALEYLS